MHLISSIRIWFHRAGNFNFVGSCILISCLSISCSYHTYLNQIVSEKQKSTQTSIAQAVTKLPTITPSTKNYLETKAPEAQGGMGPAIGIWITREELMKLPTNSPAWEYLKSEADQDPGTPNISDQDEMNDVYVMAKALVYARTGELRYRNEVISNLMAVIGTESGGRTLALGRNLASYVIAADLIDLPENPEQNQVFSDWLRFVQNELLEDRTLISTNEERPNNWGTMAGASRAAIARYLGDSAELDRVAQVFKGYLGDRSSYSGFSFGELDWQSDPKQPVGVNPKGAMKEGHSIDGVLPDDMRRGGEYHWPPGETDYPWEALQGAVVQAEILSRAGYPAWEWQDKALLRAVQFLYQIGWEANDDEEWVIWLINSAYKTNYPASFDARPGKIMGWTSWTSPGSPVFFPFLLKPLAIR
jgi:hypothetical protein